MTKKTKQTANEQGFPTAYLGPTGNFRPGMDARAKSDLINAVLGIPSDEALHRFKRPNAQKLLKARGWEHFLDRKRKSLAKKGGGR